MPKLNDIQLILLAAASQRHDRNIYPLPEKLAAGADRAAKAVAALIKQGLVEDCETTHQAHTHRTDGDFRYGAYATDAGIAALDPGQAPVPSTPSAPEPRNGKAAMVIDLLRQPNGATMAELIAATDWLPHTTRAALTGLRKKGHVIERFKRHDQTCYRIANAA